MNLTTYTDKGLARLFNKIHDRLPRVPFGWDWPTMEAVMPQTARMLVEISREMIRRKKGRAA